MKKDKMERVKQREKEYGREILEKLEGKDCGIAL